MDEKKYSKSAYYRVGLAFINTRIKTVIIVGLVILCYLLFFGGKSRNNHYNEMNDGDDNTVELMDELAEQQQIEEARKCFTFNSPIKRMEFFEDILKSPPRKNGTIFFHDTTCMNDGRSRLSTRHACAIESAAKSNPNRDVFILFASPNGVLTNDDLPSMVNALRYYPNVHMRNVNMYNYSIGTLAERWIKKDLILKSQYFADHLAAFLRLLTLYKYGGIHMGKDFVVQRNFDDLAPNFAGIEGSEGAFSISHGLFGFDSAEVGHSIIDMILREHIHNYTPDRSDAGNIGSFLRVLQKVCKKHELKDMAPANCWGFKLYSPETFYPVEAMYWKHLFNENTDISKRMVQAVDQAYAVKMWDNLSGGTSIKKHAKQKSAYLLLAEKNCPKVIQSWGSTF